MRNETSAIAALILLVSQAIVTADELSLGIDYVSIREGETFAKQFRRNLPAKAGVIVLHVIPGSPAHKAGMRAPFVVTQVNRERISDEIDLAKHEKGKPISLIGFELSPVGWRAKTVRFDVASLKDVIEATAIKERDAVKGTVIYRPPYEATDAEPHVELYVVVDGARRKIFLRSFRRDYLDVSEISFRAGDASHSFDVTRSSSTISDGNSWKDIEIDAKWREGLLSIALSRSCLWRESSNGEKSERVLTESEIRSVCYALMVDQAFAK